jgi:putative peptidoglycan binding protein
MFSAVVAIAQDTATSSKGAPQSSSTDKSTAKSKSSTAPDKSASKTSAGSTTAKSRTASSTASDKVTKKSHSASAARRSKSTQVASRRTTKKTRVRGQQKIDSERAQEIQEALIREHYLTGEAAGVWNLQTEDALRRYQADHGWQSKTVPDSRALIALGLGPSHDHLLNPQTAMTTAPNTPHATSLPPAAHSVAPISQGSNSTSVDSQPAAPTNGPPADNGKTTPATVSDPPPVAAPAHDTANPQ